MHESRSLEIQRAVRLLLRVGLSLFAAGIVDSATAQLISDDVPRERTIPAKEQIDNDLQRSRLRLGPVRLIPTIEISNAGYDNNVFGTSEKPISDWTFTVRGGFRFVVPFGSKVYLRANALPQYTWYDKLKERRSKGGFVDASLLAFFNRMTLFAAGSASEDFSLYSSELLTRVLTKTRDASGGLEVDITRSLIFFGRGEVQRVRYSPEGQPSGFDVQANDRTESVARGGLRYRISPRWDASGAFEQTWSDFLRDGHLRDNQSRAYLLGVHYDRPQFYLNLSGGYREGRSRGGSLFPEYSTGTGSFFASYYPLRWLEIQGYGRRRVAYSLTTTNPYYFENRIGGGVNVQILSRILVRGFADAGPNNYPLPQLSNTGALKRRDQARIFGGGLSILTLRPLVVTGLVTRSEFKSNIPEENRTVTRFTVGMSLSGELSR
jgi:hypothetical protein